MPTPIREPSFLPSQVSLLVVYAKKHIMSIGIVYKSQQSAPKTLYSPLSPNNALVALLYALPQ